MPRKIASTKSAVRIFLQQSSHHKKRYVWSIRAAPRTGRPLSPPAFAVRTAKKPEPRGGGARSAGYGPGSTHLFRKAVSQTAQGGRLVAARPEFRPDYLPDFIPYDGLFLQFYNAKFCALVFFMQLIYTCRRNANFAACAASLKEGFGMRSGLKTGTAGGDHRERRAVHGINDRS